MQRDFVSFTSLKAMRLGLPLPKITFKEVLMAPGKTLTALHTTGCGWQIDKIPIYDNFC
jgi:hypothetical protein